MKSLTLFIAILLTLSSCKTDYYVASDFQTRSKNHKTIAIAPSEYVVQGKSMSDLDFLDFYVEGKIVNKLADSPKNKNGKRFLSIFNPNLSIQKLTKKNYTIEDSWGLDRKKLAGILAADALIVPRFYLDDGKGLDGNIKSSSIKTNLLLLDGSDAALLYSIAETYDYKNTRQLERYINRTVNKFVKFMPYFD